MASIRRSGALVLVSGLGLSLTCAAALAQGAAAEDVLPIREITLYRSGVGSFERRGEIDGDRTVSLRFETSQINDILKSLVALDANGSVRSVGYGSKEPLERRLSSFGIDLSENPSIAELLAGLRGASIRLSTPDGAVTGTILGVEQRDSVQNGEHTVESFISLVTRSGVKTVGLSRVSEFELQDPRLAEELNLALAAIAEQRNAESQTVEIAFDGDGRREALVAYVAETPVWKTSYRLVLPDESNAAAQIQGWAIVENTTDEDWTNVRLALASGSPVAFTMDLHQTLFNARPHLPVPAVAFATPRLYEGGIASAKSGQGMFQDAEGGRRQTRGIAAPEADSQSRLEEGSLAIQGAGSPASRDALAFRMIQNGVATTGEVGEQVRYEISAPVTIERQRSAMLPIVVSPIEAERVSIYGAGQAHPMRGVRLTNTSGADWTPGPIAVYDGDAYAGDAQVGFVGRGDSRLLSHAVDLLVKAQVEGGSGRTLQRIRIVDGLLEKTYLASTTSTYTFDNDDASRPRDIIVEQQRMEGYEVVSDPKPFEATDGLWRFRLAVGPDAKGSLEVVTERTLAETAALTDFDVSAFVEIARQGKASDAVVEAVRTAAAKQAAINEAARRIRALDEERARITSDQSRIRENMTRIDRASDLYATYMRTLTEQESRLEQITQERDRAEDERGAAERDLREYLRGLRID